MTTLQLIASSAARNAELLKMTLADFTDADMLVRPCPGANHALWQIGHLVLAETSMMNAMRPGAMPELPAGFAVKFDNKNTGVDDAAFFGTGKAQLIELLDRARAATVKFINSLSEADLSKPAPEQLKNYAATVFDLIGLIQGHVTMHLGQLQVIRRKLGKPVLF